MSDFITMQAPILVQATAHFNIDSCTCCSVRMRWQGWPVNCSLSYTMPFTRRACMFYAVVTAKERPPIFCLCLLHTGVQIGVNYGGDVQVVGNAFTAPEDTAVYNELRASTGIEGSL